MRKVLIFAAEIIIAGLFIGIVFAMFNMGKNSSERSGSKIAEVLEENSNNYANYKNRSVLGEEVYRLTNNEDGVMILVKTGMDTAGTSYTGGIVDGGGDDNRRKENNAKYINPYASFTCTAVTTNDNGIVTQLTFEQK